MPPRKRRSWLETAKEYQGLIMFAGSFLALAGTLVLWGGDVLRSDHPPLASVARVEQLAQSQQMIQRQLQTTNFSLLLLSRATAQSQLDQADAALRKDPDNQIARSQHNASIVQMQIIDQQIKSAQH